MSLLRQTIAMEFPRTERYRIRDGMMSLMADGFWSAMASDAGVFTLAEAQARLAEFTGTAESPERRLSTWSETRADMLDESRPADPFRYLVIERETAPGVWEPVKSPA